MKSKLGVLLKWGALCAFVIVAASFARAFYLRYNKARMHSQCSVLTVQINNELSKQGVSFNLDDYLASIRSDGPGGLIDLGDDGSLADAWGNPLLFEWEKRDGDRVIVVRSVGRDGVRGTDDDFWRPDIP